MACTIIFIYFYKLMFNSPDFKKKFFDHFPYKKKKKFREKRLSKNTKKKKLNNGNLKVLRLAKVSKKIIKTVSHP